MPIIEFQCEVCDYKFDELLGINEDRKINCPKCGNLTRRLFSVFGFSINGQFHHSGGYVRPDREGYKPGVDDPETEIKADLKRLEDKKMHTGNLKKHRQLEEAIKHFQFVNRDIL